MGELFRFGAFQLDLNRRLLERDGRPVGLSPRGFDILQILVERRDRVVSRAEILAGVWPGVAVEEHNLSVQMSKLRRVLGDSGEDGQVIATVPGRGYRFVAAIDAPPADQPETSPRDGLPPEPPPAAPGRKRPQAAVLATALFAAVFVPGGIWLWVHDAPRHAAPPLSVVVMPLRDLSDPPGKAYLADAITDDLTTDIAHIPGSTVIARETADSYKGRAVPVGEVGRTLGVRYLLEGSIRAEAASLHINAQLIDVASGDHVWAQRFDLGPAGLDDARDQIVRRIASALNVELVAAESAASQRDRPDDPSALDLFYRARSILDHDDSLAAFQTAQSLLEQSIAKQPGFGDALAELGATLLRKIQSVDDPAQAADFAEARSLIARALAVSPRNPRALAAQAQSLVVQGHYAEASYAARAALATDASNLAALGALAKSAFEQAHLDECAQALETLLRINPGSLSNRPRLLVLGNVRLLQGHADQAIDLLQRSIAGDPEPQPGVDSWGRAEGARLLLIAATAQRGDLPGARDRYRAYDLLWRHRSTWRIAATASRLVAALPGFARLTSGLRDAGMPEFMDEHADDGVAPTSTKLADGYFTPTPRTVPGAATIDTPHLAAAMQARPVPLVIDLGSGAGVPAGAVWKDAEAGAAGDDAFIDAALQQEGDARRPLIVLSDGVYGAASYNAVLHLASAGRRALWYRGGEEAWAKARLPAAERRP